MELITIKVEDRMSKHNYPVSQQHAVKGFMDITRRWRHFKHNKMLRAPYRRISQTSLVCLKHGRYQCLIPRYIKYKNRSLADLENLFKIPHIKRMWIHRLDWRTLLRAVPPSRPYLRSSQDSCRQTGSWQWSG